MKGKLFVIFIMIGIPIMIWAAVSWLLMIILGVLHAVIALVPNLSFGTSAIVTMLIFSIVTYKLISAAAGPPPDPRHRL